jgi:hypothetical protein
VSSPYPKRIVRVAGREVRSVVASDDGTRRPGALHATSIKPPPVGESLLLAGGLNIGITVAMLAIPSVRTLRAGPEVEASTVLMGNGAPGDRSAAEVRTPVEE